jgi:branched-chain amino acid aminotransferase
VSNFTNSIHNMEATDGATTKRCCWTPGLCRGAGETWHRARRAWSTRRTQRIATAPSTASRNTIFAICRDLGIELERKAITRDEIYIADEAFFSGTAAEVTPSANWTAQSAPARVARSKKVELRFLTSSTVAIEIRQLAVQGLRT